MVDILLIQPPIRDFYRTLKRTIPYGLACIASALEEEGFSVSILDCLATSRSRPIEWPREMAYLHEYYGKPDVSPFSLFHHMRHFGNSFEHV
ncbi:MAG: cobalamin B12-binding domain-containing protein, partial [Syntrophobacteraceae bacterium]|nr:cobalamin B12-binding domain-containing protein [Syntrophobacteraceae bacterium]